jgi:hypothetical protein
MEMEMKNKWQDLGIFMAVLLFPLFLVVFGVTTAIQRVMDFTAGFIPLFPAELINGGGLVFSLIGCIILVVTGVFVFWAAFPVYKEYIEND